jgi:ribonuclease Z
VVEVLFLGTGGGSPDAERGNTALLIRAPEFTTLVEAGPGVERQLARADVRVAEVERLFVSHRHGDHALGFPMLILNRRHAETPLQLYAGLNTAAVLETLCRVTFPRHLIGDRLNLRVHALSEQGTQEAVLAPGVTLRTALVAHHPGVPTLAARWDFAGEVSLAYVTDTRPTAGIVALVRDCDLLIHEASFSAVLQPGADPAAHNHSTAQQAGDIAREANCPRLALVHLGPEIGRHPDVLVKEARAGSDLDVLVLGDGERVCL